MPGSQLKQLKASLRESGFVGPQKSKKQKKQAIKSNAANDRWIARSEALENIRERFNPFEARASTRANKFQFANSHNGPKPVGRPGVTKGLGEEVRRKTLLAEIQRRQKVGGINDRRFGEGDPTMTPEERVLQRFIKEKQRGRKSAIFNLEDDDEEMEELTHFGKPLDASNGNRRDDFQESVSGESDTDSEGEARGKKRRRLQEEPDLIISRGAEAKQNEEASDRPKTKQEVMKEIVAKSKLHKYERQKAKEDDDELRAELDEGMSDLWELLRGQQSKAKPDSKPAEPEMNPDRAKLLNSTSRDAADKEYDARMRQMVFDTRAQPASRTKTEEEKAEEEAWKLHELETQRLRRMRGEPDVDEELEHTQNGDGDDDFYEDAEDLPRGIKAKPPVLRELGVEDEDDFLLDDDLIASGSDLDTSRAGGTDLEANESESEEDGSAFLGDLDPEAITDNMPLPNLDGEHIDGHLRESNLAFTFPCPQSLQEFLQITENLPFDQLPLVVQRIRALHHPKLGSGNKDKLESFSAVLVQYVAHTMDHGDQSSYTVVEQLIRHTHSLAKSFPEKVSEAYRERLKVIHQERSTALNAGDLVMMVAIGSIFPTSDHWHQVVTPAMLTMSRYLEYAVPRSVADLAKGIFLTTVCLDYQRVSKRYIPEVVNYVLNTISLLAPVGPNEPFGLAPSRELSYSMRFGGNVDAKSAERKVKFWDISVASDSTEVEDVKLSILQANISLVSAMAALWIGKTAYCEILQPFAVALGHLISKPCKSRLPQAVKVRWYWWSIVNNTS